MHIENIHKIVECLAQRIREEFDKGIDCIDTCEMEKAIDMLKDGCDALYKSKVVEAMENPITAEIGYDMNEDPARFTMDILGSKKMKQPMWSDYSRYGRYGRYGMMDDRMMDMDRYGVKRHMGNVNYAYHDDHMLEDTHINGRSYSDGYQAGVRDSQPDYREGHSGNKRMTYMVSKEIHDGNTPDDIAKNSKLLDEYLEALWKDMEEMTRMMTPTEKATLKSKMNTMITKIA